jgi:aquaporin Z
MFLFCIEWDDSDPLVRLTQSHHNPEGNLTRMAAMLTQEFIGTFFLAWTVALTINTSVTVESIDVTVSTGCLAIGSILMSMVFAGGAISGGHYNPAVTLGVYLRGLQETPQIMRAFDCMLYVAVQIGASLAGAGAAVYVNGGTNKIASPSVNTEDHTQFAAIAAEFMFTFLLVLTVLNVATNEKISGNSYFGVAIGFSVIAGAIASGDISGGVLNPAIAFALPLYTGKDQDDIWMYLLGESLGGMCAAAVFVVLHMESGVSDGDDVTIRDPVDNKYTGNRSRLLGPNRDNEY